MEQPPTKKNMAEVASSPSPTSTQDSTSGVASITEHVANLSFLFAPVVVVQGCDSFGATAALDASADAVAASDFSSSPEIYQFPLTETDRCVRLFDSTVPAAPGHVDAHQVMAAAWQHGAAPGAGAVRDTRLPVCPGEPGSSGPVRHCCIFSQLLNAGDAAEQPLLEGCWKASGASTASGRGTAWMRGGVSTCVRSAKVSIEFHCAL